MSQWWAVPMLLSGGLFVGRVTLITWERLPAWRTSDPSDFRTGFTYTLRRVDHLQPALLVVCLGSTIGLASSAGGAARHGDLACTCSATAALRTPWNPARAA